MAAVPDGSKWSSSRTSSPRKIAETAIPWDLLSSTKPTGCQRLQEGQQDHPQPPRCRQRTGRRFCSTATPLQNSLMELYRLVTIVDDKCSAAKTLPRPVRRRTRRHTAVCGQLAGPLDPSAMAHTPASRSPIRPLSPSAFPDHEDFTPSETSSVYTTRYRRICRPRNCTHFRTASGN